MRLRSILLLGIAGGLAMSAGAEQTRAPRPPSSGVTVTDALGRVVIFSAAPKRIAIAGKASFMIANAIFLFPEASQRHVALSGRGTTRTVAGDFLRDLVVGTRMTTDLGDNAGPEQIASFKPDVVLLKSSSSKTGSVLAQLGLQVVYLDFETPDQYERDLAVLGRILGAEDRAEVLRTYYKERTARVRQTTASIALEDKPRTLILQFSERGGALAFSVPSPEWIQTDLVECAGGIPLWKPAAQHSGWTIVNLEQIAAWDPDIILVVDYRKGAHEAVASMMADTTWKALRAAREEKVFAFPGDYCSWDQPDTRWALGLLWMATRLQPDLFRSVNMEDEIVRFYALYGVDADTVRSRIIPLIQENLSHVAR